MSCAKKGCNRSALNVYLVVMTLKIYLVLVFLKIRLFSNVPIVFAESILSHVNLVTVKRLFYHFPCYLSTTQLLFVKRSRRFFNLVLNTQKLELSSEKYKIDI